MCLARSASTFFANSVRAKPEALSVTFSMAPLSGLVICRRETLMRSVMALVFAGSLCACGSMSPVSSWDKSLLARSQHHPLVAPEKSLFSGDKALQIRLGAWWVEAPQTRTVREESWIRPGSVRIDEYPEYSEQRSLEESETQTLLTASLHHPDAAPWQLRCQRERFELKRRTETRYLDGSAQSASEDLEQRTHLDCQLSRRAERLSLYFDAANGRSEFPQVQSGEKTYPLRPIFPSAYRGADGELIDSGSFRAAFSGGRDRISGYYFDCAPQSPCAALELGRSGGGLWLEREMPNAEQEQLLASALAWWLSVEAFDLN